MSEQTEAVPDPDDRSRQLAGRLQAMLGWVNATLPWRVLLLVGVLGALLHVLGVVSLPFWPFTTAGGRIYVDSPEVYTRERLVNDRYEQDYWLREQLRLLNQVTPEDLASGRLFTGTRVDIGDAPGADADNAGPADAETVDELDFRSRYEVLSGIRDMLRQQILENMLDDRHDLTANSVYGLKFDTTIIPGNNTRRRAFVEVELKPVDLFLGKEVAESAGAQAGPLRGLDGFQRAYLCKQAQLARRVLSGCEDIGRALGDYDDQRGLYNAWLEDIEKRLNSAEESLFEVIAAQDGQCPSAPVGISPERYADLVGRSLEVVLNLPQKRFIISHQGLLERAARATPETLAFGDQIRLPEPYSDYMQITAIPIWIRNAGDCSLRVQIVVEPVREQFIARRVSEGVDANPLQRLGITRDGLELASTDDAELFGGLLAMAQTLPGGFALEALPCDASLSPFWRTADGAWQLLMDDATLHLRQSVAADFGVVYETPGQLLEALATSGLAAPEVVEDCGWRQLEQFRVDLPSGFFNFVDSMRELDAYAYAVFPKNDVRGILRQTRSGGGAGGAGGGLGFLRELVESRTEPMLVGFGGARDADEAAKRPEDPRSVRFGWVIASADKMQPSLKTQLALVSVPAWTNHLTVEVTTGWLDRAGRRRPETERRKEPMEVKLPPDFGAFDSIFRDQGWVTPAPQIRDQEMDQAIYVVAGQEASILIPGLRLWRSTSVTLGSQSADRIRVLPNMEGIIAEFRPVRLPFAKYKPLPSSDTAGNVEAARAEPARCTLEQELPDGTLGDIPGAFTDLEVRPVRLRVWTSEGVAVASQHACVIYDPQRQVREGMTKPAQGGWVLDTPEAPTTTDGAADVD